MVVVVSRSAIEDDRFKANDDGGVSKGDWEGG